MSSNKKDLTRIEDLGEYLHEIQNEEEIPDFSDATEEIPSFENTETLEFNSSEESPPEEDFASFNSNEGSEDQFETSSFSEENLETNDLDSFETPIEETENSQITEEILEEEKEVEAYSPPENFEDVRKFAESTSFTPSQVEANPSFGLLLKNIKYSEDVEDILSIIKEYKLLNDSEEVVKSRLQRGRLFIPRISEYAAIFLSHKLRRFDLDIQMGLSDEIHPPKHQEAPELGVVSKYGLFQNQSHHFEFDHSKLDFSQIVISTTSNLDGYHIVKYLGVVSENKIIDQGLVEDEHSNEILPLYQELADRLKAHALSRKANAVIGLNYQLTPLPADFGSSLKYRLTCTGNLVWVNKI
ncbi:MAG: hypothetical protein AB7I27_11460 [Bacteriovoracaceae bacterium]